MVDHFIQGGVKWSKVRECGGSFHSGGCVKWPNVRECGGSYSFGGCVK